MRRENKSLPKAERPSEAATRFSSLPEDETRVRTRPGRSTRRQVVVNYVREHRVEKCPAQHHHRIVVSRPGSLRYLGKRNGYGIHYGVDVTPFLRLVLRENVGQRRGASKLGQALARPARTVPVAPGALDGAFYDASPSRLAGGAVPKLFNGRSGYA